MDCYLSTQHLFRSRIHFWPLVYFRPRLLLSAAILKLLRTSANFMYFLQSQPAYPFSPSPPARYSWYRLAGPSKLMDSARRTFCLTLSCAAMTKSETSYRMVARRGMIKKSCRTKLVGVLEVWLMTHAMRLFFLVKSKNLSKAFQLFPHKHS